jgi:uncharacterized membrane protein
MKHRGIKRLVRHIFSAPWVVKRYFPPAAMHRIEAAIKESERSHTGEIRFAVEADLHPIHVLQGKTPRRRAIELFAELGIWDTEANNGVLIYLSMADRDVEIIADRGVHHYVGAEGWETICKEMEAAFRNGQFEVGVLHGIHRIGEALQRYFPVTGDNPDELPDQPVVL